MTSVEVGAFYCTTHDGIANEDDSVCDFAGWRDTECEFEQLFYEAKAPWTESEVFVVLASFIAVSLNFALLIWAAAT